MPGGVYDVAPASGHVVPEFPEPWFTRAGDAPEAASEPWFAEGGIVTDPGEPQIDPEAAEESAPEVSE